MKSHIKEGKRQKMVHIKAFISLHKDVCTSNSYKPKNSLASHSWTDFSSWEQILYCCMPLLSITHFFILACNTPATHFSRGTKRYAAIKALGSAL